jgi:hypothetical protein
MPFWSRQGCCCFISYENSLYVGARIARIIVRYSWVPIAKYMMNLHPKT